MAEKPKLTKLKIWNFPDQKVFKQVKNYLDGITSPEIHYTPTPIPPPPPPPPTIIVTNVDPENLKKLQDFLKQFPDVKPDEI